MRFLYFLNSVSFLLSCNQDKPKNNSPIISPLTAIIAVPTKNYKTIFENSIPSSVKNILKTWFCNYKGDNIMKLIDWGNQEDA